MNSLVKDKVALALDVLRELGEVAVAFSGGVDSTLVLVLALKACRRVTAVTVHFSYVPTRVVKRARSIASALGVDHVVVEDHSIPGDLAHNPPYRCYLCKKRMIELIRGVVEVEAIVDGSNADDYREFRPGLRALQEEGVLSPLAVAGMGKGDVRAALRALGVAGWDAPPTTCLLTRIPYWSLVTQSRLRRIEEAENVVREVAGVGHVRVRDHWDIARIEVPRDQARRLLEPEVATTISSRLRRLGYRFVTLDLEGYRTGCFDPVGN